MNNNRYHNRNNYRIKETNGSRNTAGSRTMALALRSRQESVRQRIIITVVTVCIILCGVLVGSSILASGKSRASQDHASFKYYTSIEIRKGDSLWSIAEEHMSRECGSIQAYIDEVKKLNGLVSDDIHAGQYLTIPYYSADFH